VPRSSDTPALLAGGDPRGRLPARGVSARAVHGLRRRVRGLGADRARCRRHGWARRDRDSPAGRRRPCVRVSGRRACRRLPPTRTAPESGPSSGPSTWGSARPRSASPPGRLHSAGDCRPRRIAQLPDSCGRGCARVDVPRRVADDPRATRRRALLARCVPRPAARARTYLDPAAACDRSRLSEPRCVRES